MKENLTQTDRALQLQRVHADVVVAGAGIAGISVALAAARKGMRVTLINDRPILGGAASSEIRVGPGGAAHSPFNRYARETGIIEEIFNHIQYKAQQTGTWTWPDFDEVYFDLVLQEKNIQLFLNTTIYRVNRDEEMNITSIEGIMLRAEKCIIFEGNLFIDCTGDGTVGYLAGADYRMGREGREETKELYAPDEPDEGTMGASLLFTTTYKTSPVTYQAPSWAIKFDELPSFGRLQRSISKLPDGTICGFWWMEYGGQLHSIYDDDKVQLNLRRLVYGIWDYIKNSGDFSGVDNQAIDWIGYLPGKRESRRLMGDYVVTVHDFLQQRHFDDSIGYTGWPIDVHPPEGYRSLEPGCTHYYIPGITDIPMRALYSRNIPNLMFAGRDISCTHAALGTLRLIITTSVMGQAVGTAASMCVEKNLLPRELVSRHIEELRYQLARDDQSIIGYRLEGDFSKQAKVTVSSSRNLAMTSIDGFRYLDKTYGIILPVRQRLDTIQLYLGADSETMVQVDFYLNDDKQQNYRVERLVKTVTVPVKQTGWYDINVGICNVPGNKLFVLVRRNPAAKLYVSRDHLTGCLGIETDAMTLEKDTEYRTINHDGQVRITPCFQTVPQQNLYGADSVTNGFARPYGLPNLWISDNMDGLHPEYVTFKLQQPQMISQIELVFNSELNHKKMDSGMDCVNPELVKSYRITARTAQGEFDIIAETENFKRFRRHAIKPIKTDCITVYVHSTWGGKRAEIYDVRLY